ncbi:MAG: RrF2 family transcriptional regulator [Thermodesulfobacteriota bacterium]
MRMSTKGRYGLRVMMELAENHGRGPTSVDVISKNQGISKKYIHFLMTGLKSAGLIRTVRGPNGGFELAKPPASISALDVIAVLEGWRAPVDCVANAGSCPRSGRCAAREVWSDVGHAVDAVLSGRTLAELSSKQRALRETAPDFCI